jgi:serine/threonine-protein kinase
MSTSEPTPSTLLGARYRLDRRVAQGGMAEVWLATDIALSRQVAVKLLKPHLAADPVVSERFRREAIAVAGLSHPNIVAVYDAVDDGGRQAVVMQYVQGKSLRQLLDEQRRLSPELTIHVGCAVAGALDAAHHAGLVHRDVKPGNILITADGRVMLADFGIAKAIGSGAGEADLTSDNVMMGTAKYLSPEQVRGRKLDGRADLYSLGLVLYECLAGRVPFLGETDADTALARLQRDPTDLHRLRPTLSPGLVDVVHRMLARDPADRPENGATVRSLLARVGSGVDDATPMAVAPVRAAVAGSAAGAREPRPGRGAATSTALADTPVPDIPGQPPAPTPPSQPDPAAARRDRTPPRGKPVRQAPAKRFEQRPGRSTTVVLVLLAAALVIALALANALRDSGGDDGTVPVDTTGAVTTPPGAAPVEVLNATTYDPNGDGSEHDDQLPALFDNDPTTAWTTVCYESQYMGAKEGVGIVTEMSSGSRVNVEVAIDSAPWQLRVYTADAMPTSLDGWGEAVASDFDDEARGAVLSVPAAGRYVLVLMAELGPSEGCSDEHPYQGRLSELRVTPI